MKTFNREINKMKSRKVWLVIIVVIIAILFFMQGIVSVLSKNTVDLEFDKNKKVAGSAKTTILCLIGPLLEVKEEKNGDLSEYYIAVGKESNLFIIRLKNENIDIPILGKDLKEEDIGQLQGVEISGSVQLTSSSLKSALNSRINLLMNNNIANSSSFDKVFGGYYLDTILKTENDAWGMFILSGVFAIIGLGYLLINKRIRRDINETIDKLSSEGKLNEVINEFEGGKLIDYRKLKVYLLPNYIFSYSAGLEIIAFKDIKDVSPSKKEIGKTNRYIIITTKENTEHYIAPIKGLRERSIYNELLNKLKEIVG